MMNTENRRPMEGASGAAFATPSGPSNPPDTYDFFLLSRFRGALLGFAILCIVMYHSTLWNPAGWPFLSELKDILEFGVDIFLFLSGIGLYFSFNSTEQIPSFYKKRFKRILLAYIPIATVWFAFKDFSWSQDIRTLAKSSVTFVEDISLISFWMKGNLSGWFIALIILLYILYPFIHRAVNHYTTTITVTLLTILFCLSLGLIHLTIPHETPMKYFWIELTLPRIPAFIFGCWIASKVKDHKKAGGGFIYLCLFIWALCFFLLLYKPLIWEHLVYRRFLYGPLAVCTSVLLSFAFCRLKMTSFIVPLEWLGIYTLEIYLLHEKILWLVGNITFRNEILLNAIAVGITFLLVPIYKQFYTSCLKTN